MLFFFSISSLLLWLNICSMLVNFHEHLKTKVHLPILGGMFIMCYIPLVNCIFQIYIPPEFPPLPALSVLTRDAKISNYNFRFAYIPLESIRFCFMYFETLLFGLYKFIVFMVWLILWSVCNPPFVSSNFSFLKSVLYQILI